VPAAAAVSGWADGATVLGGGTQILFGGLAIDTVVSAGGILRVGGGNYVENYFVTGTTSHATVRSGGLEAVQAFGIAGGSVISGGGEETVASGGMAIAGTVVASGGAQVINGMAVGTVLNGGKEWVNRGGVTSGTIATAGGTEVVYGGGIANGTLLSSGGFETISRGIAHGTVVRSDGFEGVFNGGTASNTVISGGGKAVVYAGGVDRLRADLKAIAGPRAA